MKMMTSRDQHQWHVREALILAFIIAKHCCTSLYTQVYNLQTYKLSSVKQVLGYACKPVRLLVSLLNVSANVLLGSRKIALDLTHMDLTWALLAPGIYKVP